MMAKETQGEPMPTNFRAVSAMESPITHRASRAEQSEVRLDSGVDTAVVPLPGNNHVQDRSIAHSATLSHRQGAREEAPSKPWWGPSQIAASSGMLDGWGGMEWDGMGCPWTFSCLLSYEVKKALHENQLPLSPCLRVISMSVP